MTTATTISPFAPSVECPVSTQATMGSSVTLECSAMHVANLTRVQVSRDGQTLAALDTTSMTLTASSPRLTLTVSYTGDAFKVTVTFSSVACADDGNYTVVVGNEQQTVQTSFQLKIKGTKWFSFV